MEALLSVIKSEDIEGGRYAAFGIANLAVNANHREKIVEEGSIMTLVSLACCEDVNTQVQAVVALRGICVSPEYRAAVVREGILDPLVLLSRSEEIGVLREVFIIAIVMMHFLSLYSNKLSARI